MSTSAHRILSISASSSVLKPGIHFKAVYPAGSTISHRTFPGRALRLPSNSSRMLRAFTLTLIRISQEP
jgi:hypothetical protein